MAKIVRLDNVAATANGSLLKSAKYFEDSVATAIENGEIVDVEVLVDGEREIHKAVKAETSSTNVGIVCTPEVIYDQSGVGDSDLANFTNAADDVIRVALLTQGDIFSIAGEASGTDKTFGNITAKFLGTEKVGRHTYNVYEVM